MATEDAGIKWVISAAARSVYAMDKILAHLNRLNTHVQNSGKDTFLPHYEGFERVYRRTLSVPTKEQRDICIGYNANTVLKMKPSEFLAFMKRGIEAYSQRATDFDILVIYIPKSFAPFRTASDISPDFNHGE